MLVNKVYRNQRLTLLNVFVVLAVLSLVGFLQWLSGWPVQEAFVVLAAVICAVICGFACGDVGSSASEYPEERQRENEAHNAWSIYPPRQDSEDRKLPKLLCGTRPMPASLTTKGYPEPAMAL